MIGTSFAGAAAGGFVGVAGAVDFGTLKNDTSATIEGYAVVRAKNDIEVNALGDKNLDSYAFSGAGGAVALAASVSVWSIGRQLDRNYTNREGQSGDASKGDSAQDTRSADEDAATQSNRATTFTSDALGNFGTGGSTNGNTSNNRVRSLGNTASSRISGKAPTTASILASLNALASDEPGTTAKVKSNAQLIAGDRIDVMSDEHAVANGALGTIAGGLAALGAAVGINNMATNSTASIGGSLSAGGDIRVHARHNSETDIVSVAGTAGFVGIGAAVAFINDRTEVAAYTEANTAIAAARNIEIHAIDDRDHYGWTGAIAGGVVAGGASFVRIEVDNPVANRIETRAHLGSNTMIGMGNGAVENLSIKSAPNIKANSEAFGIALGVAAVSANFSEHNLFATSSAQIGSGSMIDVENLVQIESKQTYLGTSEGIGIAGGAAAVGVMRSDVEVGSVSGSAEIRAGLSENVTVTATALSISARAEGDVNSESVAGSGGGFAGAGGIAGVQDYRGTLATIGANSTINVVSLTVDSVQDTDADSQASAVAFGAVTGVGVEINNDFYTAANTQISSGVTIDASYILIGARNNIEKDKFGVGSGINLDAVSVSVAGGAGMVSDTRLGTVSDPYIARVDVAPGAIIRALGTYDEPGVLAIEARTDFEAADRANSGEYSLGGGVTVGDSRVIANTLAQVNVSGATIENRFGELVITARGDGTNATIGDIHAASGFSSVLTGTSRAETNANQNVTIHNANLKAKDIRLGAGEDRNKATNALNVVSSATGFVVSLFPGLVVDSFSVLNEKNSIDITGNSKLLAFGDIDLVTREGIGGSDRSQPIGDVVAIGLTAFAADADVYKTYDSDNDVNIGANARLTAGVSSRNVMQVLPVTQTLGGQSIVIGNTLSQAQKAALFAPSPVPNGVDYHFAPLDISSIRIDFYAGYVVKAVAGANAGGTVGNYYQFLPTDSDQAVSIRPDLENYNNAVRWKPLGAITQSQAEALGFPVYESDVAIEYTDALSGKFAVAKSVDEENVKLTYRNIGNLLFSQRDQILEWMADHQNDPEAIARYQVQLDSIEGQLAEFGLTSSIPGPNGSTLKTFKKELDALFIELPGLVASPGSIFIEATAADPLPNATLNALYAPMVGTRLNARGEAAVNILNVSPFTMTVNGAFVEDNRRVTVNSNNEQVILAPGNVYVNFVGLTNVNDTSPREINIVQNSTGSLAALGLPITPPSIDQDMYIQGDVINEDGLVRIDNQEGSIYVQGEVRGDPVQIIAAKDFNLNTDAWFHSNRDPRQYLNKFDSFRTSLFNARASLPEEFANLLTPYLTFSTASDVVSGGQNLQQSINEDAARILAQGTVTITARFLNVNGLIQSGSEVIEFGVAQSFVPPTQTRNFISENGTGLLPGISFGVAGVPVDGYWDSLKQAFVIEDIEPEGGHIVIAGQLLSTGNGRLKVANGYPSINIDNDSPYEIIFGEIDTTKFREGLIEIIDSGLLTKAEYRYLPGTNQIRETRFTGVLRPTDSIGDNIDNDGDGDTDDGQIARIVYTPSSPVLHPYGANIQYTLPDGLQYVWVEGQRFTQQTRVRYDRNNSWYTDLFPFIDFDETYTSRTVRQLDNQPLLESETLEVDGTTAVPAYAVDKAYTLSYQRRGDPKIELIPNSTLVRNPPLQFDFTVFPVNLFLLPETKVYRYVGPGGQFRELALENYSDTARWQVDTTIDPNTFKPNKVDRRYDSNHRNRVVTIDGPYELDDGDITRIYRTTEEGKKDFYTHTLKADYPIGIQFSNSPSTSTVTISSAGNIRFLGNVSVPTSGQVFLTSTGGSVLSSDAAVFFGASPTVLAAGAVDLQIEGNRGPLFVTAGDDVNLTAISLDNLTSSFAIGAVSSTDDDVTIDAKDGIANQSPTSTLRGDRIDLRATSGGIGTSNSPLRIESNRVGTGGLVALAEGNIFVDQIVGNLPLVRPATSGLASVESTLGNVTLIATAGSILDGDNEQSKPRAAQRSFRQTEFVNKGIANSSWSAASSAFPTSAALVQALNPGLNFGNFAPSYSNVERLNVKAANVTLTAAANGGQVGFIADNVVVPNPANYGGLTPQQAQAISEALPRDIVGTAYGTYRFLGSAQTNVDLKNENFANTARWQKINPNFTTGGDRSVVVQRTISPGSRVRVETNSDEYGMYEFIGSITNVNLNAENYRDPTRWRAIVGQFASDGPAANLTTGVLVTNKAVVDAVTIRKTEDLNVEATAAISATAHRHVHVEDPNTMPINRIVAGNDMILRSGNEMLDNGAGAAAIALAGNATLYVGSALSASGSAFRTQVGPGGSLRVEAGNLVNILQRSTDTNINGAVQPINNLFVSHISAGQGVDVVLEEGSLFVGYITSLVDVDLRAPTAILDGFASLPGKFVNIFTPSTALPGHVYLQAGAIGSIAAPVTVDIRSGELTTQSTLDQFVMATSNLSVRNMVSTNGNITLWGDGQIGIGSMRALAGTISVQAFGSIIDLDGDAQADVEAVSIVLNSLNGSIGLSQNDIEVDTADTSSSRLSATARHNVYVTETTGRVNVLAAQSTHSGNVRLATTESPATGEDLIILAGGLLATLDGDILLLAADNLTMNGSIHTTNLYAEGDHRNRDAVGSIVTITGSINATTAGIVTDEDADTVLVVATMLMGLVIRVGKGDDEVTAGGGDDLLFGGDGRDILRGGDGDDYLDAGIGIGDELYGGHGDDTIIGSAGGTDSDPNFNDTTRFGDYIDGGEGNDTILTLGGADYILGGDGDDSIDAGDGNDLVFGGAGNDTIYAGLGVADEINGDEDNDLIIGSNSGNDILRGGSGNDRILGQSGNDLIEGGDGDDYLDGGAGTDQILGGLGNDEILGGGGVNDQLHGDAGDDVIRGSNDGADVIFGGTGRDRIYGNAGNDQIQGGDDDDVIEGNAGDDLIFGDRGSDIIIGGADHDRLYGLNLTGTNPDNSVDFIYGDFATGGDEAGSGQDQIFGASGRDLLYGEAGDDLIDDDLALPGVPNPPSASLDLIDYGSGDGPNPTTFTAPLSRPIPRFYQPGQRTFLVAQGTQ